MITVPFFLRDITTFPLVLSPPSRAGLRGFFGSLGRGANLPVRGLRMSAMDGASASYEFIYIYTHGNCDRDNDDDDDDD